MTGVSSIAVLRDVQTLFEGGSACGLTDRHLLDRFTSRNDEAAFEALVRRHGPMVLRVCRNGLRDHNDVEDAFQATFLVLVRKSGSTRKLDSVGGWLYGVACRVAARAGSKKHDGGRQKSERPCGSSRRSSHRLLIKRPTWNSAPSFKKKSAGFRRNTVPSWCSATGRG